MKRGMAILITGFVLLTALIVAGSYMVAHHLSSRKKSGNVATACRAKGRVHIVVIANSVAKPAHTQATQCDLLTIINRDQSARLMAFGKHESHIIYDGISERLLGQNEQFTVTLVQTGDFRFHDHLHDEVGGEFTVAPR